MPRIVVILFIVSFLFSCNTKQNSSTQEVVQQEDAINKVKEPYFPVTNYLKGQINEVKHIGVNPIKYVTVKNITDSSWLKLEDFDKEFEPFLEPVIDTSGISHLFSESKFLDQTLNTYTFTYDPEGQLSDDIALQHWDVYVNPKTDQVTRIYILKKAPDNKILQLTWQSNKWCKIVTLSNDKSAIEKEVLIKWDF